MIFISYYTLRIIYHCIFVTPSTITAHPNNDTPWWRHQMETFSALLAICAGNSPVTSEFPSQRPVTRSVDIFFDLRRINGWVNDRKAGDLRRHPAHYDVTVMHSLRESGLCLYTLISALSLRINSLAMRNKCHSSAPGKGLWRIWMNKFREPTIYYDIIYVEPQKAVCIFPEVYYMRISWGYGYSVRKSMLSKSMRAIKWEIWAGCATHYFADINHIWGPFY